MKAVDFFCGVGGLTRGLLDAGIDVAAGYDIDARCGETYEHNNQGVRFHEADIAAIDVAKVRSACGLRSFDNVLFAGCAPCQPFSPLRKGRGRGKNATLLAAFGRIVEQAKPGYVLVENVPGIARVDGFSTFRRFVHMLQANDYGVAFGVLDAKNFGVPQTRRRLLLLAVARGHVVLPTARYGSGLRPLKTVRDAIARFPPIRAGERHSSVANHIAAALAPLNLERMRATPHDGGDRRSWPDSLLLECHRRSEGGFVDTYGRMHWDAPSPTLTGRCHSISNGRYGHPEQDRAISLREAAAIQSFPDGYVFFGNNDTVAQQIGNAVPPRLAEWVGRHLLDLCAATTRRAVGSGRLWRA